MSKSLNKLSNPTVNLQNKQKNKTISVGNI